MDSSSDCPRANKVTLIPVAQIPILNLTLNKLFLRCSGKGSRKTILPSNISEYLSLTNRVSQQIRSTSLCTSLVAEMETDFAK